MYTQTSSSPENEYSMSAVEPLYETLPSDGWTNFVVIVMPK